MFSHSGLKMQTGGFVIVALAFALLVAASSLNQVSEETTYTVNGLTCSIPSVYSTSEAVGYLVPLVTREPQFLNLTHGSPYELGNAEMLGSETLQIDNQPPQHLPPALEMVFYTYGPKTTCEGPGNPRFNWLSLIVVHVPLLSNGYNLTGATYHLSIGGPE